ncbi:MAG TPA: hypothetical protein VN281_20220 [Verrucomicrobiae bacterium]|nr:hypothetical protein [Verrucomicrobiae bacterium]
MILSNRPKSQSGFSLFMTLVLVGIALTVLGATVSRTMTVARLNDRNNTYVLGNAAAEAATEKVLSRMMLDFESGGLTSITNNLSFYRATVPTSGENGWWTNFVFSDGQGNANATYVAQASTNASPAYVQLETQYPGLMAFAATYRVLSDVHPIFANNYGFTNAVQQDVQMAEIPVYQFAVFYNSPLEFTGSATLTVSGRVHCNTNICVGQPSGSSLTFSYFVTSSGLITNPPLAGLTTSSYAGTINYNGTPSPGWGTGEPVMTLPIGDTNNSAASVRQILNPPPAGESVTNPISPQRLYNKADIVVMVSNNSVNVTLRSTPNDSTPLVFTNGTAAWTNANLGSWVGTNSGSNAFYDARQGKFIRTVQIDVGKLGTWLKSNTNAAAKWSWASANPFNGVVYVGNFNDTNSAYLDAVRLTNGLYIDPSTNAMPLGLTVATANPLYIQGNFNATNYSTNFNYLGSSNVVGLPPASVLCDAITMLSPSWNDANDSSATYNCSSRTASSMTCNAAILAGNVPTTGSTTTTYSGGVQNFCRLLENWNPGGGQQTLTLNTSIVCLFSSAQATNQFVQPTGTASADYYEPPIRHFYFNANYSTSGGLPPGTPFIARMIRATWCSAPADTLTYAPSPTLDFVPQ